jgi:hypothetical protein
LERLPTISGCWDMALKRSAPRIAEYGWIMVHKAGGTQIYYSSEPFDN